MARPRVLAFTATTMPCIKGAGRRTYFRGSGLSHGHQELNIAVFLLMAAKMELVYTGGLTNHNIAGSGRITRSMDLAASRAVMVVAVVGLGGTRLCMG